MEEENKRYGLHFNFLSLYSARENWMSMADTKQVVFLLIFLFDHDVLPVGF